MTVVHAAPLPETGAGPLPTPEVHPDRPPTQTKWIEVYICPTPGCSNYFGSSTMPRLETTWTGPKTEDRHQEVVNQPDGTPPGMRHTRAACPDCRERGLSVERVRQRVVVVF